MLERGYLTDEARMFSVVVSHVLLKADLLQHAGITLLLSTPLCQSDASLLSRKNFPGNSSGFREDRVLDELLESDL